MIRITHDTESFRRPQRGPLFVTAVVMLALATIIACRDRTKKTPDEPAVTVTSPGVSTPEGGDVSGSSTVPVVVTLAEAESTYKQRRYADATQMFESYVQRHPTSGWGQYMLGLSAWKSGELDRARVALERSSELDPKHVKSLLNLSRVLLEQGRTREAFERVTAALEIDSTSAEVHRMMGRVRTTLGEPDAAIESYRTALSFDPVDVWSMNNLGLVLIKQGRFEDALGPLARAVQLRPGAPAFHNNLGIALERTGHFLLAAQAYGNALAIDSTYGKASLSLARVTGNTDDPTAPPVELTSLAQSFEREVQQWKDERSVQVETAVKVDTVPPPEP